LIPVESLDGRMAEQDRQENLVHPFRMDSAQALQDTVVQENQVDLSLDNGHHSRDRQENLDDAEPNYLHSVDCKVGNQDIHFGPCPSY
jgi:hypothetical protein